MTAVTSKMNRMVLLYILILSMVSLPTSLPRHLLVETADNQGGDDYDHCSCFLCCWDYSKGQQNEGGSDYRDDYSISPKGPKKNYKKELTKTIDDMKRQGKDYGGFTDFLKEAVEVVGPAWKVVGPDLQKGFNALKEKLNKGELFLIPAS